LEEILAQGNMNPRVYYENDIDFYRNQIKKLEESGLKRELTAFTNERKQFSVQDLSSIIDLPKNVID